MKKLHLQQGTAIYLTPFMDVIIVVILPKHKHSSAWLRMLVAFALSRDEFSRLEDL